MNAATHLGEAVAGDRGTAPASVPAFVAAQLGGAIGPSAVTAAR
ncbi:hypothetical protein ABT403_20395 [Streptomyces sp. NPDC000075]